MLFDHDLDYIAKLSENIAEQMKERNREIGEEVYWINNTDIPAWNFIQIAENQNFYFNNDGNLVIVFDEYQVAPGYMGNPEFIIPANIYESGLK